MHYKVAIIQAGSVFIGHFIGLILLYHSLGYQFLGIQGSGGAVLANNVVHQRLGRRRLVGLVVAATAVTNQINYHIFAKLIAVVHGQHGRKHHRIRVIAIHVQNRRLHHLGNICAVFSGARIILAASGKANLVVDHDMNSAASFIGASLGELEGFHHYTLTGKGRITVHQNRHYFLAAGIVATILAGAARANHHRAGNLQVRRVKAQRHMHLTPRSHHIG